MHPLQHHLPPIFAGSHRCNQATSRVCESEHDRCTCTPKKISRIHELKVGNFVQVTRTDFVTTLPHPEFEAFIVVEVSSETLVLNANVDISYPHRILPLNLFWSAESSTFADSLGDIFLYQYGFISNTNFVAGVAQMTKEYAYAGVYTRPVYDLHCMRGSCRLTYDGAEHGIFRLSKITSFCISLFYLFDEAKLTQRCEFFF
jgi:hypothetical protein